MAGEKGEKSLRIALDDVSTDFSPMTTKEWRKMDYSPDSPHLPLIELILQLQQEGLTVGLDLNGALIVQGHKEGQKASPAVHAVMSKPLGPPLAVWLDVERVEAGLPPVTPIREQIPRIAENIDTDDQDLLDTLREISFFVRAEIAT